jgi:hypothetical protein
MLLDAAAMNHCGSRFTVFFIWRRLLDNRATQEVFEDHLRRRATGDLAGDLEQNYARDVVLLCKDGVLKGLDAVRASAEQLGTQLPNARFEYITCLTHEEYGFLEWRATSDRARVDDGADSYVIRDGRIQVQTIHYTLNTPD